MAPIVLGYWDIRGLAQTTRLLLEFAGADWEDKLYSFGPPPDFDSSCWTKEKETLGFDFPNLPWLTDGDVKLTQSEAILRYVARKYKLDGQTEQEKQGVDLILAETKDHKTAWAELCYNPNFATLKPEFLKKTAVRLERLSKFLGDRPYFVGKNVTVADICAYDDVDLLSILEPGILKGYKNLEDFHQRFEKLDRIAAFLKSPKFIKFHLNGRMAAFGGEK